METTFLLFFIFLAGKKKRSFKKNGQPIGHRLATLGIIKKIWMKVDTSRLTLCYKRCFFSWRIDFAEQEFEHEHVRRTDLAGGF